MDKLGQPWKDCNPIAIAIQRTSQRHTLLVSEMIDYVVRLRHHDGEICKNVVAASCISIKYGITDIFKFVVQVLFLKEIFGGFFFMRKALIAYMHDLGYKLLASKWIHILTTLSYNHNLQYTYKRDMDAVLHLSKRRKWILSKTGYFWIPAIIHQRSDCYQYTEATSLCYVQKRLFPICWCIKTDKKTLLFLKMATIKPQNF